MKINVVKLMDLKNPSEVQGLLCFKTDECIGRKYLDKVACSSVKYLIDNNKFNCNKGEVYALNNLLNNKLYKTILVGMGKKIDVQAIDTIRNNTAKLVKKAIEEKVEDLDIHIIGDEKAINNQSVKAIAEAAVMSCYKFDRYKTDKVEIVLRNINIVVDSVEKIDDLVDAAKEGKIIAEGNIIARQMGNEPSNVLTPEVLAKNAQILGQKYGFDVQVYEKGEIENFGMEAFLSVGKGSSNASKLIVMKYNGDTKNSNDILGLVGKGITFDAGGYCLKSRGNMWTMKNDMGGAAAVIGTMTTIARMKLKKNVVAVIAACENLISGQAYKPGDIINTMNGKTIEILNTDAEGRLTLIDAITYIIRREKVSKVIDIATLTGAVVSALGDVATGVVDNDDELYGLIEKASKICDEKVWRFPTFDEYGEALKSGNADLVNSTGSSGAGTIRAGLFIKEFTEGRPWVHLDIAGVAFSQSTPKRDYLSKGATGAGTRLLYEVVKLY